MKRKIFGIVAALVLAFAAAGCGGDEPAAAVTTELFSFETREEIRDLGMSQRFGKLSFNENAAFIKNGTASLGVYPYGDFEQNIVPELTISIKQDSFPTMDFSGYSYIALDVYNSGAEAVPMEMWLTAEESSNMAVASTPVTEYELPAGQWSKVVYDFGSGSMSVGYPLENVTGIKFLFPDCRTDKEPYDPAPLYFDNLIAVSRGDTYAPQRASGELLYFENLGDVFLLTRGTGVELSNNGNPLFISQGSLSVWVNNTNVGNGTITIGKDALAGRFENAAGVSLDLYNAAKNVGSFVIEAVCIDPISLAEVTATASALIFSNEWETVTLSADDMPEGYTFSDIEFFRITVPVDSAYIDNFKTVS